jgi:hypothetical protein
MTLNLVEPSLLSHTVGPDMPPSEKRYLEGDAPTPKRQRLSSPGHPVKPVGDCMHLCTAFARASLPAALESDISWRKVLLKLSPHRVKGPTVEALETGSAHPSHIAS